MRKYLLLIVGLCACAFASAQVYTLKSKKGFQPGSWFCFRNTVTLDEAPEKVRLSLAADTKYWLWVNGELQVREGGDLSVALIPRILTVML